MDEFSLLCGRLNAKFDIAALREYYLSNIIKEPPTQYRDNNTQYEGWAITSRNGEVSDYLRRPKKQIDPLYGFPESKATKKTKLCKGPVLSTLKKLEELDLKYFRTRIMRLMSVNFDMNFHRDTMERQQTFRLHIPIFTNPESFFQWKTSEGEIIETHLPADGSAYIVRVDLPHRAVNNIAHPSKTGRVHFLCGIKRAPRLNQVNFDIIARTSHANSTGQKIFNLSQAIITDQAQELLT